MQQVAKNIFYVGDFLFGTNCKLDFFTELLIFWKLSQSPMPYYLKKYRIE